MRPLRAERGLDGINEDRLRGIQRLQPKVLAMLLPCPQGGGNDPVTVFVAAFADRPGSLRPQAPGEMSLLRAKTPQEHRILTSESGRSAIESRWPPGTRRGREQCLILAKPTLEE